MVWIGEPDKKTVTEGSLGDCIEIEFESKCVNTEDAVSSGKEVSHQTLGFVDSRRNLVFDSCFYEESQLVDGINVRFLAVVYNAEQEADSLCVLRQFNDIAFRIICTLRDTEHITKDGRGVPKRPFVNSKVTSASSDSEVGATVVVVIVNYETDGLNIGGRSVCGHRGGLYVKFEKGQRETLAWIFVCKLSFPFDQKVGVSLPVRPMGKVYPLTLCRRQTLYTL
jgi:hypothetical protein